MKKVAIVTDTLSTIPRKIAEEHGIKLMPMYVVMDGKDYPETEVDRRQLYDRIRRKDKSITTSSPSPGDYLKAYQELSQKAESILCITFAPSMGMAYKAAIQAAQIAQEELPKAIIKVIDSRTVSVAQLLIVLAAAKAAAQDKSLDEAVDIVNDMVAQLNFIDLVPTSGANDLAKEGRAVSKSANGSKPRAMTHSVMEMSASTGGVMTIFAEVGSRAEGMEKLIKIVRDRNQARSLHIAISYSDTYDETKELKRRLLSQFQCIEIYLTEDSLIPTIHQGLGALKLGWYSEE